MTLRLLERGAAPRTLNLLVRNGSFRVRVGVRRWRRGRIEARYAGSAVYQPVTATLTVD